jgi:hypothetical protein
MTFGHEQLDVYPLNIAEGNGEATDGDRRRFYEMARGSALECSAVQDVLEVRRDVARGERRGQQASRPHRRHADEAWPAWVHSRRATRDYGIGRIDADTDSDPDADKP